MTGHGLARLGMAWHGRTGRGPARLGEAWNGGQLMPAQEVGELVSELKQLLPRLEALLPEPVADPTRGTTSRHRVSGSPAPWHPEAGPLVLVIHQGIRELEQDLKWHITRRLMEQRGGSDANTTAALDSIVRLVHGVDDDTARGVRHLLDRWIEQVRQIRDIGESEKWIPIHVPKGQLPPSCLYCRTFSLRVAQESGRVACVNPKCEDEQGNRPRGRIEKNRMDGSAMLVWADGRTTYYYGREAS